MSQFPLTLRHQEIRRLIDQKARTLILGRRLRYGTIAIEDALIKQRNEQARRRGHSDHQEDEHVMTVEIDACQAMPLMGLTLIMVRGAGYKTQRDFYDYWLERRRWIDCDLEVFVHSFHPVSDPRYLHARVHRGYTSNPAAAANGEPEALSRDDLEELSRRARRRLEENEAFQRQQRRSIGLRAKDAAVRGDVKVFDALRGELATLCAAGTALAI